MILLLSMATIGRNIKKPILILLYCVLFSLCHIGFVSINNLVGKVIPHVCASQRGTGGKAQTLSLRVDSHIPCRSTAMQCLFHLIYIVGPCLIHTYRAVSLPCLEYAAPKATSQDHGRVAAGERCGMCELASAVQRQHVGDLPAFGFFRLPCGVPGRLLSEAYHLRCRWPV
jgi:hypothetical protein